MRFPSQVAAGADHTVLLTDVGKVLTFGNGLFGRLGHGDTLTQLLPRTVHTLTRRVVMVVAGQQHTLALCEDGGLYTWGNGQNGRLGHGDEEDVYRPKQVSALRRATIAHVSAGGGHSLVTTRSGRVFAFGLGEHGQLGLSSCTDALSPMRVTALSALKIATTSCGGQHSCFVTDDGMVFACGKGTRGRLGTGDSLQRTVPEIVRGLLHC